MTITLRLVLDEGVKGLLQEIVKGQNKIMAALDTLTADVTANTDVTNSAITLLNNLAQQIKDAGTDPVKLKALTDKLEGNSAALAAAITANTPAA